MCGLAGFLSQRASDDVARILGRMGDSLSHRGPDNYGEFLDPEAGVGFAHRRLAIIDLSPAGNQPMVSASGRYVISLNGEFYNHPQLRSELEAEGKAPNWKSSSDIETLLAGFDAFQLRRFYLQRIVAQCEVLDQILPDHVDRPPVVRYA